MADEGGAAGGGPALSLEQLLSLLETMPMEESQREALRDSLARQHGASQRIAAAAASRLATETAPPAPPQAQDLMLAALAATVAFILLFLGYRIYKSHSDTTEESATKRTPSVDTNKKRR